MISALSSSIEANKKYYRKHSHITLRRTVFNWKIGIVTESDISTFHNEPHIAYLY